MTKRVRLTGKATGHKVDEDTPDEQMRRYQEKKYVVMVQAKVSEEDARYLVDEGYWDYAMHQLRKRVALKNSQRETMTEEDDG